MGLKTDRCAQVYCIPHIVFGHGLQEVLRSNVDACVVLIGTEINIISDLIVRHKKNENIVRKERGMIWFKFMK